LALPIDPSGGAARDSEASCLGVSERREPVAAGPCQVLAVVRQQFWACTGCIARIMQERCPWLARMLQAARLFLNSWHGMHAIFALSAFASFCVLVKQMPGAAGTPRFALLQGSLLLAALTALTSAAASLWAALGKRVIDQHVRYSVLSKACMVANKGVLVAMPVQKTVDVGFLWSCGPDVLCPDECKQKPGGLCARSGDRCGCVVGEVSTPMIVITLFSSSVMFLMTLADLLSVLSVSSSKLKPISLFSVVGVNLSLLFAIVGLTYLPASCYLLDFQKVLFLAAPYVPSSLLANEVRWLIEGWKPQAVEHGPIYEIEGLCTFAPASTIMSIISFTVFLGSPPSDAAANCVVPQWCICVALAFAAASSAATLSIRPNGMAETLGRESSEVAGPMPN